MWYFIFKYQNIYLNSYNYKYKINFIIQFNLILNIDMEEQKEYLHNNQENKIEISKNEPKKKRRN